MITESTTEVDYADFKLLAAETEVSQTSEDQIKDVVTDTPNIQQNELSEQPVKRKRGRPRLSESKKKKVTFVNEDKNEMEKDEMEKDEMEKDEMDKDEMDKDEMDKDGESFINALSLQPEQDSKQGYKRPRGRPKMSDILKKIYQSTGKVRGRPKVYKKKSKLVGRPRGRPRLIENQKKDHKKVEKKVPSSKSKIKKKKPVKQKKESVTKSDKWKVALCEDTEDQDPDVTILRLTGRHFPDRLETESMCHVCKGNGLEQETDICCKECTGSPPLCCVPCFKIYHTAFRYLTKTKGETSKVAQSKSSGPKNIVKKARGRPKKEDFATLGFSSESVPEQDAIDVGLENNTIVKKRGRPKKKNSVSHKKKTDNVSFVNTDSAEDLHTVVAESSKKKRGRPKRNATIIPNLYIENISDSEDENSFLVDDDDDILNLSGRPARRNTITPTIYTENSSDSEMELEENCLLNTSNTSNEYEIETTKRPRGRPKKEKKARGRPRKDISPFSMDPMDVEIVYIEEAPESVEQNYETENKTNTVKRGRGRPRKEVKLDPLISPAISQSNVEYEILSSDDE